MKRKNFLKSLGLTALAIPLFAALRKLRRITDDLPNSDKMPVLFLGHGSPMNAIEDNEFVQGFIDQGKTLPKPNAILVVSAHWETKGTYITAMEQPRTIHDFGGFPEALYKVQYPAPGNPILAKKISETVTPVGTVHLDEQWGLDHGSWSVVKHLFPEADVPVIQMSLDYGLSPTQHFELAKQLNKLREKGVLIIGSGNMVHNLRRVNFQKLNENFGFDWALEASEKMKKWIVENDFQQLINFKKQGKAFNLAIPTPEHYLPLLYTMALKDNKDDIILFNDVAIAGAITMTSVKFG